MIEIADRQIMWRTHPAGKTVASAKRGWRALARDETVNRTAASTAIRDINNLNNMVSGGLAHELWGLNFDMGRRDCQAPD